MTAFVLSGVIFIEGSGGRGGISADVIHSPYFSGIADHDILDSVVVDRQPIHRLSTAVIAGCCADYEGT
jgi:hypothetical protein